MTYSFLYDDKVAPFVITYLVHLQILSSEERDGWGSLSPCLEFLVTERVLASLASFAWCDRPLGVRQHAYIFLAGVLAHLHHSHLHHARIHKPLQVPLQIHVPVHASMHKTTWNRFINMCCVPNESLHFSFQHVNCDVLHIRYSRICPKPVLVQKT